MSISKCLVTAVLVGVVFAGPACSDKAVDETKRDAGTALDATKSGANKAINATEKASDEAADVAKDVVRGTAGKTAEIAGDVTEKSREVAAAVSAEVTDGWITTKVKAKFTDESVLKGSDINVDTTNHVVTLKGTVLSLAAKARAEEIARGTERVTRVVNRLFVE